MSIDKLSVFEEFPPGKDQGRIVLWIKKMYRSISRKINFLLSLVNSGFVEIPADDVAPGADGNWRWRVDGADLVLQRKISGTWTDTAIKMFSTGTITSGDITIFDPTPILVFQDSNSLGAASVGFIEWRDSGGGRAGFFGNSSSGNDDLLWKNEQGGNIGIQTTGAGEFQIVANTVLTGTLTTTGDIMPVGSAFLVFEKASGNGIKVDQTTPTFGFADLLGDQFSRNTGGTKPVLTVYNGDVDAWQFGNGDEAYLTYHIPHDYVLGTDIHLHIHWSQNAAGATGGTLDFKYSAIYAKGHNQASGSTFTATPKTDTFSSININDGASGLDRYQQHLTEVTISAATATAALFDRDDFEPDGIIELTLEMTTTNLTGTPSLPFIHHGDIHYQTTGLIGTKNRTPDFYN